MSNDWVSAFDSQCRSEGLEVPEKAEQADQPSSTMDQNEENKGFSAPGIGRGGVFGGGKSAPPPQTSFGATSGTRMGGAFGSTPPGVDGRGAPLGSSEEGGGNVISVGVRRNKPACTFTRGGSFGTNRSTSPSEASSSFKNNHEGGRFGTLAPKSVGGAFSSKADSLVANNSTVGGSFGSARTVGGSFGSSSAKLPTNSVGGAFGASKHSVPESSALHEQENSISFNKPLSTTLAGGYEFDDSKPSKSVGGAFRSNASIGGTFGAAKSTTVGGAFGRKLEVPEASAEHSEHPLCLATSESSESLEERKFTEKTSFGGSFGAKENKNPNSSDSSKLECQTRSLRLESSFGGGFGANILNDAPFMPGQQSPIRGGFQGGYRGGRGGAGGVGGHMDFAAGQGHAMGRGRGHATQPFVPQPRSTPPPFQTVVPDGKYKYTKPSEAHEKAPAPADIALLNKYIAKEVKMMKDMDTVVDVQRQDPKSPLYSISSFRELRLKPEVLKALDALNFQFPTRIQETALPLLLMEPPSNLIAQAQSGTGKTAAFVLTMLCRIDVNLQCPQCICLAPTIELAKQIGEVVEKMGMYMENLKIHYAIKGSNMAAVRGRMLTEQIVIGTPGTTRDYLQKYKCIDPAMIRCLVLDEADVMIYHQGFTDISTTIYNMVEEASDSVQSMLFSATYDEPVINFATKIIKNAIVVMLKREEQALPNIKQFYVECASRDSKYAAIVNLYSGLAVASSVIFCHTKASVMWLFENMKARGHQVDVLHGEMDVLMRADTIIRFRRGDFKVLITTNLFARGIDVAQVSVVINYDLPIKYTDQDTPVVIDGFTQPDCETYLHRIGRTGRFGKTGIAINFIDSEDSMNMINVLENHFQMKITRMDPSNIVELEKLDNL